MWTFEACYLVVERSSLGLLTMGQLFKTGLKFNPLFLFVCFNVSLSFKNCEEKTSIDPGKIYEKIFSSLQMSSSKICFEF